MLPKVMELGERVAVELPPPPLPLPPVPVKGMVCGLPGALSVTLTCAVRVPVAEGVNFRLMVQLLPAATELPQVPRPAKAKSPALAPVIVKLLEIVSVALPVLARVTYWTALVVPTAWLGKVTEDGVNVATGPDVLEVAVPERDADCDPPVPLSVTVSVAV